MTAPTDIVAFANAAEERAEATTNEPSIVAPVSVYDVPTLARMVIKMAETLEAYALDEDKELGKLAYVTLFNLTAELKGADHADDR